MDNAPTEDTCVEQAMSLLKNRWGRGRPVAAQSHDVPPAELPVPRKPTLDDAIGLGDLLLHRKLAFYRSLSFLQGEYMKWRKRGSQTIQRPGTIMEFGVWNGESMIMLWDAIKRCKASDDIHWHLVGFDSFEGMPEPRTDADRHRLIGQGSFRSSGREHVTKRLIEKGIPEDLFTLHEGWFDDLLTDDMKAAYAREKVSFVNIDIDYYSSTMQVLNWIEDILHDGSLVYFDDILFYYGNPQKGQLRAIREFNQYREHSGLHQAYRFDPCGRVFIYWRDEDAPSENLQF